MKTSLLLIFDICIILSGATAIAQPPQWPNDFPYPSEFPSSGENVTFSGSGDATGAFVATFTFYTTGGTVGSTFQVTDQIVYTFQEFTDSAGVTSRKKLRIRRSDFRQPQQNFDVWERNGFTEFLIDQTAPPNSPRGHVGTSLGSFTRSISHRDHNWDYSYDVNDNVILFPIIYTDDTNFASRIDSATATSATMSLTSHRVRSENRRLPFHFDRDEEIKLIFVTDDNLWSLDREYIMRTIPVPQQLHRLDGDFWPNSSGQGGVTVPDMIVIPPPTLSHFYDLDCLQMKNAYDYELQLIFDILPWNRTPF